LGATYFLVRTDGKEVDLPMDEFFTSHFKLVHAGAYGSLFKLAKKPLQRKMASELLQNPGNDDTDGQ
jgi:hypothetical protein